MTAAPHVLQTPFGKMPDSTKVTLFTLTNSNNIEVKIINYGGIITSIKVPDITGMLENIVLGFDNLVAYTDRANTHYFGALIGRYVNRIAKGKFSIDGTMYQLDTNENLNHLHGGSVGFDKQVWEGYASSNEHSASVGLSLISKDGDQGYPGNLTVQATYTLTNNNELELIFEATTDQATPVNLSHHSYFNLANKGDILDHQLMINANTFTPINDNFIPNGKILHVENTPFDFRNLKEVGESIKSDNQQLLYAGGYDHNWVLNKSIPYAYELAARVIHPSSGRLIDVYTTEPGIQFYSGNFLDGTLCGQNGHYNFRSALCLEPQHFPNSPNQPSFPNTLLRPGEKYQTKMRYQFSLLNKNN